MILSRPDAKISAKTFLKKELVTMKFVCVLMATLLSATAVQAQQAIAPNPSILPNYIMGPSWFPTILKPYQQELIKPLVMENSPRLHDLIRNGKLRLSMADTLALAIENNLDIAVQRFLHPIAEADVLRASSGQAARGIAGALVPSGLTQGALGVGVNQFQGAGGVGSAGGISGGGGAVQIPQVGTFDPSVSINFSLDRTSSPLNTLQVAGVPQVSTTRYWKGAVICPTSDSSWWLPTICERPTKSCARRSQEQLFKWRMPTGIWRRQMKRDWPRSGIWTLPSVWTRTRKP